MLWIRWDRGITPPMPWILCLTLRIYPIGGLDWSDIAQEAGSYPCHPAPKARKPLLLMDLPYVGREGSKFWKLRKDAFMEIIVCQSGGKNKSLRKLPPSLPVLVGGFCTIRGSWKGRSPNGLITTIMSDTTNLWTTSHQRMSMRPEETTFWINAPR